MSGHAARFPGCARVHGVLAAIRYQVMIRRVHTGWIGIACISRERHRLTAAATKVDVAPVADRLLETVAGDGSAAVVSARIATPSPATRGS